MGQLSIEDLKKVRRWTLWRLEPSKTKPSTMTKTPYGTNGFPVAVTEHANLHTFAELQPYVTNYSGVGLALGLFDGTYVGGVDLDKCCDVLTGKFSPESREVVIALDSYAEYSPSGTGCHVWVICEGLPGKGLQKPYPGAKQIEVKGQGYYHTYTGRHLEKTPSDLMERHEQITAL